MNTTIINFRRCEESQVACVECYELFDDLWIWDNRYNITPDNYNMSDDETTMCDKCFRNIYGDPEQYLLKKNITWITTEESVQGNNVLANSIM